MQSSAEVFYTSYTLEVPEESVLAVRLHSILSPAALGHFAESFRDLVAEGKQSSFLAELRARRDRPEIVARACDIVGAIIRYGGGDTGASGTRSSTWPLVRTVRSLFISWSRRSRASSSDLSVFVTR